MYTAHLRRVRVQCKNFLLHLPNSLRQNCILLAAFVMLSFGPNQAYAQAAANVDERPASVPAEYVVTPFGYFHPSCVLRSNEGDVVHKDLKQIQHSDGSYSAISPCAFSHFDANGDLIDIASAQPSAPGNPGINHSYISYAVTSTNTSYGELTASWNVPPAPASTSDGQTLFFFPGFVDYNNQVSILQPVLAWNKDFVNAWSIASWNCCIVGTTFESTPLAVTPGDTINGKILSTCAAGTLSCPSWNITTTDVRTAGTTTLSQSSSDGQIFNEAFSGALEVYSVNQCADYPTNGQIAFTNVTLYDNTFKAIASPSWSNIVTASLTPSCNYSASAAAQQATLTYGWCNVTPSCYGSGSFVGASTTLSCFSPIQINSSAKICGLSGVSGGCSTGYGQSGILTYSQAQTQGTSYGGASCTLNWCINGSCSTKNMTP